jgi:hypothetical protein
MPGVVAAAIADFQAAGAVADTTGVAAVVQAVSAYIPAARRATDTLAAPEEAAAVALRSLKPAPPRSPTVLVVERLATARL